MPAPPKPGESKDDFIGRCIPVFVKEGKAQDQAIAICYSMWREKKEDILNKLGRILTDEIVTGDIEKNTAKGKVDLIPRECPKGQIWDKKIEACVPVSEGSIVGGSYIDGTTVNIVGSGQTRIGPIERQSGIEILTIKQPGIVTRFNRILGAYVPDIPDEEENVEEK